MTTDQLPLIADTQSQPEGDTTKVLIPRATLIAHGQRLRKEGQVQAGNAVLTGCIGQGEYVPVSRALAERWGLTDG
jgi:hypothetical protein